MQWLCKVFSLITYFFSSLKVPTWNIFWWQDQDNEIMLNWIVNESIKTLLLSIKWLLMLSLHKKTSILCECWFKEKGIIQIFLSLLIIIMCWLFKMSLNNVAFNYWYQKMPLFREVYHYESSYLNTLANTAFTLVILFWLIFTMLGSECNVIVRESKPIRLLESPWSPR